MNQIYPNNQAPNSYNIMPPEQTQIAVSNSGLDYLMNIPSIYVKQKPDYLESLGFFEIKNVYFVYQSDAYGSKPDFQKATPIFKCKEEGSCLQRQLLPGDCRAFEIKVKQYDQIQDTHTVLRMSRQYKCTCICLARPMLEVFTELGIKIGQIFYPWMCCDRGVIVQDHNGQEIYKVIGSCCQWPFFCKCPCETCQKAVFHITDIYGHKVSEIRKETAGCCQAMLSDASNFGIVFPLTATPIQKALLLATSIFLDMNYFEVAPVQRQNYNFN